MRHRDWLGWHPQRVALMLSVANLVALLGSLFLSHGDRPASVVGPPTPPLAADPQSRPSERPGRKPDLDSESRAGTPAPPRSPEPGSEEAADPQSAPPACPERILIECVRERNGRARCARLDGSPEARLAPMQYSCTETGRSPPAARRGSGPDDARDPDSPSRKRWPPPLLPQ